MRKFFNAGIKVALCSDNWLLAGDGVRLSTPAGEVAHLVAHCGFSWDEARKVLINAAEGAMLPAPQKAALVERYTNALDRALAVARTPSVYAVGRTMKLAAPPLSPRREGTPDCRRCRPFLRCFLF